MALACTPDPTRLSMKTVGTSPKRDFVLSHRGYLFRSVKSAHCLLRSAKKSFKSPEGMPARHGMRINQHIKHNRCKSCALQRSPYSSGIVNKVPSIESTDHTIFSEILVEDTKPCALPRLVVSIRGRDLKRQADTKTNYLRQQITTMG